ncbi:JmjC domain, hydroxylase-domain-containing protein [Syncephalis fuscata]|nr:JmjC domain, hydroxylase-domain-containing protein [Syncephalis fuscata]
MTASSSSSVSSRSRSPSPVRSKSGIRPNHYYEAGGIPVFCPTMEQFQDFARFVDDIYAYGHEAGIAKVIPPAEWVASLPSIDAKLTLVEEFQPIVQHIFGSRGCYTQTNIESRKRYTVDAFRALAKSTDHRRPLPHQERGAKTGQSRGVTGNSRKTTRRGRTRCQRRTSPSKSNDGSVFQDKDHNENSNNNKRSLRSFQSNNTTASISPPASPSQRNAAVSTDPEDQESNSDDNSDHEQMESFLPERCQELERDYWRNLTYNPPLYGADIPGSLFDDSVTSWNVAHLKNLLDDLPVSLPGVNSPYLYFGMWKSTFAWHVEDMDLFSINYIHFGAPKQWYSIPETHRDRFERVAQGIWSPEYQKCPEFLRHKTFIISPKALANYSIPVNRLVQKEHEFVLTFPRGYHAGYNLGYNCAESVNFALDCWIPFGKKARNCQCIGDSVHIDMDAFFESADKIAAKDKSNDMEEDEAEVKHEPVRPESPLVSVEEKVPMLALPTTPVRQKSPRIVLPSPGKRAATSPTTTTRTLASSNSKDVLLVEEKSLTADGIHLVPPIKRRKQNESARLDDMASNSNLQGPSMANTNEHTVPHGSFDMLLNPEPECLLCPLREGPLLPVDDGRWVHRICATCVPETGIMCAPHSSSEYATNIDKIPEARWKLKCQICSDKHGACVQCVKGKCVRAFHVTCAQSQGLCLRRIVDGEPDAFECFCAQHNPLAVAAREEAKSIALEAMVARLQKGLVVSARVSGNFYSGTIQSVESGQQVCSIQFDDGLIERVPWKNIRLPPNE